MTRTVKTLLAVGVPAAAIACCAAAAPYYTTIAVWELRSCLPLLGVLAAVLVGAVVFGAVGLARDNDLEGILAVAGAVAGLGAGILWAAHTSYEQDRTYLSSIRVTSDPVPTLAARAPFQVGEAQARPNLGDTSGTIVDTTYLPGEDRYATLVERRGWLSGYEVAYTQHIPLQGRGEADRKCGFDRDRAGARVSGYFGHNLGRLISEKQRWVRFDSGDVYAYCQSDGHPIVVVPLKRQTGVWVTTERPAGAALYDGQTGDLTITTDTAGIPGPSYPLSLAKTQREATAASGGFWDWVFGRAGWETSDDETNAENSSEFTLSAGGSPVYVTPLTGRGSATAISVVAVVPARHSGLSLAPVSVHRMSPVWVSLKAIEDKIRADYQDIPNWQNIHVYEVSPSGGNGWVATLGTGQNVLYRVSGTGDLRGDKATCLLRADGTTVRCGTLAGVGGNGVGTQYGTDTPGGQGSPPPAGDLRRMSDAELANLQQRVAAEAACRLAKTCKAG
ncbi:hypothetical protein ABZ671_00590 [Micromonospora sp. NPDC006766]|uniref:hypothetical protein n=1 Tax=Micromonospora sp. NPDC006766 TaxID=3154778 RepID=UPI0033E10306